MTGARTITALVTFTANTGVPHTLSVRFTEQRDKYLLFSGRVSKKLLLCESITRIVDGGSCLRPRREGVDVMIAPGGPAPG